MTVPIRYPVQPQALASFDYSEFATGLTYVRFFLFGTKVDASPVLALTTSTTPSDANIIFKDAGALFDFEALVETPLAISENKVYFSVYVETDVNPGSFYWTLYRTRDGSDKFICSGGQLTEASKVQIYTMSATPSERVDFNKGDIIKINAGITGHIGGTHRWYYDPSQRISATESDTNATILASSYVDLPIEVGIR